MSKDASILKELKKGSKDAFSSIYYQYKNLVFYRAYSILNSKEDADDIVSDTYLRFMNNLDKFNESTNIKNMLCMIARNLAIDLYRRNQKRVLLENCDIVEDTTKRNNEAEMLVTLNKVLDPDEAKIVTLHVIYEYKFNEIASEEKTTIGVIQAKYYKAIKKLKAHYSRRNS